MTSTEQRWDSQSWLLESVRAIQQTLTESSSISEFGTAIPEALTEPELSRAAWIGSIQPGGNGVEIRSSSASVPPTIELHSDQSATQRATDSGDPLVQNASETAEYQRLQTMGDIPQATTSLSIPFADAETIGVLHLYVDFPVEEAVDQESLTMLGELIDTGFQAYECRRELAHERQRLEALRSLVSHDLGNPINLAAGRLDLARTAVESEHLGHVETALKQIDALADEGLTFVKAGRKIDDRARVDLGEIAPECWEVSGDESATLSVEPTTVYGNSERLRMILNQLFENAIVHNDGSLSVSVGPVEPRGFYVEDDGNGIPEDEQPHVFDRGYTTDSNREGNGLAVVEEIATAHGWTVQLAESDGTRIEIRTARW